MNNRIAIQRRLVTGLLSAAIFTMATPSVFAANNTPGKGVTVQPLKSTIAEETFQTLLVMKALSKLGYSVKPIKEVDYPAAHLAIANGDATFLATHWDPLHTDYFKNSGGNAKLWDSFNCGFWG